MNNMKNMELNESKVEERHVIALLLLKPEDTMADHIIGKLNYFHHRSGRYVNIYVPGYSVEPDSSFNDIVSIKGPNNTTWYYSDVCFINVIDELNQRLSKWEYSGEPELIILQNNPNGKRSKLDFSHYYCIEIDYGINNGFIRSFEYFMEQFIKACKSAVTSDEAVNKMLIKRLKPRSIVKETLAISGNVDKIPNKELMKLMSNELFVRSCRRRNE